MRMFDTKNLTTAQLDDLFDRDGKKMKRLLTGKDPFGLDRYQCAKYLNITNDTFHKPMCYVEDRIRDEVYVKAVFFGSGILSHPVRYGWMPVNEVRLPISITKVFFLNLWNLIPSFGIRRSKSKRRSVQSEETTELQRDHSMDIQRVRSITTGIIHTTEDEYYQDVSRLSGQSLFVGGDFSPKLCERLRVILADYMRTTEKLGVEFFDGKLNKDHVGSVSVVPLTSK